MQIRNIQTSLALYFPFVDKYFTRVRVLLGCNSPKINRITAIRQNLGIDRRLLFATNTIRPNFRATISIAR